MTPTNPLELVRRLAADVGRCELYTPVVQELGRRGLDSDDLLNIIVSDLGEVHCFATKPTVKYYPATVSDYYSIWVDECICQMFLKLLVDVDGEENHRLYVTSFKKDKRYV